MWQEVSDYNKRLILSSVIYLSGVYLIAKNTLKIHPEVLLELKTRDQINIKLAIFGRIKWTPDIEKNPFKFDKIFVVKRLKKLSVKIVYLNESDQDK